MPVHVIPNCVPVDVFRPLDRETVRTQLGIQKKECVLVFSAHSLQHVRKGGNALLACMRTLANSSIRDEMRIILLGSNPPPEFLSTGLKVNVLGYVENQDVLAAIYNAADMLVLPSMAENLPNVLAEALACGTPAVAFNVGGIPEMILHEKTGYLANPGDIQALLAGILWAAEVRTISTVRRLCRAKALEQWNPLSCAQEHIKLYQNLLEF